MLLIGLRHCWLNRSRFEATTRRLTRVRTPNHPERFPLWPLVTKQVEILNFIVCSALLLSPLVWGSWNWFSTPHRCIWGKQWFVRRFTERPGFAKLRRKKHGRETNHALRYIAARDEKPVSCSPTTVWETSRNSVTSSRCVFFFIVSSCYIRTFCVPPKMQKRRKMQYNGNITLDSKQIL